MKKNYVRPNSSIVTVKLKRGLKEWIKKRNIFFKYKNIDTLNGKGGVLVY